MRTVPLGETGRRPWRKRQDRRSGVAERVEEVLGRADP
jgi:hypothetical protein